MTLREEFPEVLRCYQCMSCTLGCPMAQEMDLLPHEVMGAVQLGRDEEVLGSSTPWVCASCEACATRCPNEIEIVQLMDLIRRRAVQQGMASEREPELHRVFLKEIERRGRVHELSLLLELKRRTGLFKISVDELRLGLKMLLKGKLKVFPGAKRGGEELKRLFARRESP